MKFLDTFFKKKSLSQVAREEGYVTDQKGIQNRFVREREHWQLHLDNTKQYILQSAKRSASKKSVAVLGSGWLLDVPVAELAQEFEEVYLYDIVHPEQIVVNMRKYPNVHLVVADLTDGAEELAAQSHSFEEFCNSLAHISLTPNLQQFDFVVSVNLLNQLDIILCDYLKEKFSITESELIEIRKQVQQHHVDSLPKGKTCLITDFCEENTSLNGTSVQKKKLLYCSLPTATNMKEWQWIFDTNQTYHEGQNTILKVKAIEF